MSEEQNDKKDFLKIAKIICLITPTILSLLILFVVGSIVFGRYYSHNSLDMRVAVIENMGALTLSIIGIAVTAWVGLNIYNAIERREVEDLKKNVEILEKAVNSIDSALETKMLPIIEKQLANSDTVYNRIQGYLEMHEIEEKYNKRDAMLLFLIGQLSKKKDIQFEKAFMDKYLYEIDRDVAEGIDYAFQYLEEYIHFENSVNNFNQIIGNQEDFGALKDDVPSYKDNPIIDRELINDLNRIFLSANFQDHDS